MVTSPTLVNDCSGPNESHNKGSDKTWMMRIRCKERTSLQRRSNDEKVGPALSTLEVSTDCSASGVCRAIILYLRKQRYPVVGDRLCQMEFQQLPRSIRNRIKKKLCFGCFHVDIQVASDTEKNLISSGAVSTLKAKDCTKEEAKAAEVVAMERHHDRNIWVCTVTVPERLKASYWQQHWENATVLATRKKHLVEEDHFLQPSIPQQAEKK